MGGARPSRLAWSGRPHGGSAPRGDGRPTLHRRAGRIDHDRPRRGQSTTATDGDGERRVLATPLSRSSTARRRNGTAGDARDRRFARIGSDPGRVCEGSKLAKSCTGVAIDTTHNSSANGRVDGILAPTLHTLDSIAIASAVMLDRLGVLFTLIARPGEPHSRYLIHTDLRSWLKLDGVQFLTAGSALRLTAGLQYFQHLLGYEVRNLRIVSDRR